jgi:hypothetical protein
MNGNPEAFSILIALAALACSGLGVGVQAMLSRRRGR